MCDSDSFQIHINAIRNALWREPGRAAVMVGAGFSRNAKPLGSTESEFPDWYTFTEYFVKKLAESDDDTRKKLLHQANSAGGIMQLLQEFEATFGRDVLDQGLKDLIPDNYFEPGNLHIDLLKMPWTDVFTTNYDTLLEKAARKISYRCYDVVYTQSELAQAVRPRIIKLHGSLPANKPFILTEEDYRTYPQKFSLFVNTVQQALTENIFCLIGFSGSDPNFLEWIGWVRDRLGANAPMIYLCGLLNLRAGQEMRLNQIGVIPVDLCREPSLADKPADIRHAAALEWLLNEFKEGEGYKPEYWPEPDNSKRQQRANDPKKMLPFKFPNRSSLSDSDSISEKITSFQNDFLAIFNKTALIWQYNWAIYPGWLILPENNRQRVNSKIKESTQAIISFMHEYQKLVKDAELIQSEKDLIDLANLLVDVFRINFQFCLTSAAAMRGVPTSYQSILDYLLIFCMGIEMRLTKPLNHFISSDEWLQMAICLLNSYAESLATEQFYTWLKCIHQKIGFYKTSKYVSILNHKAGMFAIETLDMQRLDFILEHWQKTDEQIDDPYSLLLQAAFLAEIGRYGQGSLLVSKAVNNCQINFNLRDRNIYKKSLEAWVLVSWHTFILANESNDSKSKAEIKQIELRWNDLWIDKCHANEELERLKIRLSDNSIKDNTKLAVSEQFIRLMDKVGLIYRVNNYDAHQQAVLLAATGLFSSDTKVSRGIGLILRVAPRSGLPVEVDNALIQMTILDINFWWQQGWNALPELARRSTISFDDGNIHEDGRHYLRLCLVCQLLSKIIDSRLADIDNLDEVTCWSELNQAFAGLDRREQDSAWKSLTQLAAKLPLSKQQAPLSILCDLLETLTLERKFASTWNWQDPILSLNANRPFELDFPHDNEQNRQALIIRWNNINQLLHIYTAHPNPKIQTKAKARIKRLQDWGLALEF